MTELPALFGYRMPAEWEPHASTWLAWPHDPDTFPPNILSNVERTYIEMIAALVPHETVHVFVNDAAMEARVRAMVDLRAVFHRIPTADVWIRDYGPIFIKKENGERAIVDFIFNIWGNKWSYPPQYKDDLVPQYIAKVLGLPIFEPKIILEGGSIDVNGKGTVLTTEQCLLHPNRNLELRQREIEQYLEAYLGVSHIVWLGEGIAGDDTDGHVDDIARFVNPTTIICAVEDDVSDENYRPLKENLERLEHATDQDGKRFTIATLPMPEKIFADDRRLPASYANFYIANEVLLAPVFHQPNDEKALQILEKLFPGRRIVPIECTDLVFGYGAIHCVTQQKPA